MSAIALVGSVTLLLSEQMLKRVLTPLVAFAAGALLGGAFLHMLPAAARQMSLDGVFLLVLAGFAVFFALEQFLHWHHCHREAVGCKKPLTYLILIGDGLHNLIGGLAIGGIFLIDIRLGVLAWLAAAAHEVPQELGDYAVLLHGGWKKGTALLFNFVSGLTFLLGGLIAYSAGQRLDVTWLVPFAAGNFIYIGASDLIPEVKGHEKLTGSAIHFAAFLLGILLLLAVKHLGHE
ncbi:MAG: Zinc transporter ZupT [Verrucomicrobiae bacterium]|nr:Zinc transporter ZupT [Verrucomicrobiae bacterium]